MGILNRLEFVVPPMWVSSPLAVLGLAFVASGPMGFLGWHYWLVGLVTAVAAGVLSEVFYELTVVSRTSDGVVIEIGRRRAATRREETVD